MPKPTQKLKITLTFIVIIFLGFLTYVSLLGENNRINALINNYFTAVKARDYAAADGYFGTQKPTDETHFILELALQERYGIKDPNYSLSFKRDHFWLPYVSSDTVDVSVKLEQKVSKLDWLPLGKNAYVSRIFTVKRVKGAWRIESINPGELEPTMQLASQALKRHSIITKLPQGFKVAECSVDTTKLTELEKRVMAYQLEEAARQLH